jgi:hypothetical protein
MCGNWLGNNPIDGVSSKIIETLASYPLLTINDLSSKLNCSVALAKRELTSISMIEGGGGYLYPLDEYDTDISTYERHLDMLQRCVVICRTPVNNRASVCELSLIGIMLYLTLVRHKDPPPILVSACNKIGYNYGDRLVLPFIFGKWSMLRKNLGPIAAYNFEVLLNKEGRNRSTSLSVVMGGICEFYENMKSIINYNIEEMRKIHDEGEYTIESAMRKNKIKPENIVDIERKLLEVSLLSSYDDLARLQHNLTDTRYLKPELIVQTLCDAFSEEITFLYYFYLYECNNFTRLLNNQYYISSHKSIINYQVKESRKSEKRHDNKSSFAKRLQRTSLDEFSRRKLIQILGEDNEIHNWFHTWVADIYKFQNEVSDVISKLEF